MTIGIYCIENLINGKRYVGKSVNIYRRFTQHKSALIDPVYNSRRANRYLWASVQKNGWESFKCIVLEELELDEVLIAEREMYWMEYYDTCNPLLGYNLMKDSSSGLIMSEDSKRKISESAKHRPPVSDESRKRMSDAQLGEKSHRYGKTGSLSPCYGKKHTQEVKDEKSRLSKQRHAIHGYTAEVSEKISKYSYEQYTMSGEYIQTFARSYNLTEAGFNTSSVNTACSGRRNSNLGFIWKRIPKIPLKNNHDDN